MRKLTLITICLFCWIGMVEASIRYVYLCPISSNLGERDMLRLDSRLRLIAQRKFDQINELKFGDAYNFQAVARNSRMPQEDSLAIIAKERVLISLELLQVWDIQSLVTSKPDLKKKKFNQVLHELTNGQLKAGKEAREERFRINEYDGLTPYSYDGKHCLLLWDRSDQCLQYKESNGHGSHFVYSFDYSLRKAKQVALCRYAENCYVLLLLTNPIQDMSL